MVKAIMQEEVFPPQREERRRATRTVGIDLNAVTAVRRREERISLLMAMATSTRARSTERREVKVLMDRETTTPPPMRSNRSLARVSQPRI